MKENLTISSVGDISFSTGLDGHDYNFNDWISDEVRQFLKSDIQIGNLECVFYPKGERKPSEFNLSEEDSSADALIKSGFDVLSLANNHICDYFGYKGIKHTIEILEKNNINHCGAGINIFEAQKPTVIELHGLRVGVFGRVHEESFENISKDIASENTPGAAPLRMDEMIKAAKAAKHKLKLDIIILYVHWGIQDIHNHTYQIDNIANTLLKNSDLDIILGSHSHCIQGLKLIENKMVCYGQGNFYFYPQILEDGVLYDSGQDINRTSLITKINLNLHNKKLKVDARIVKQNKKNSVVFVDENKEKKILAKVFGRWKDYNKFLLYFEYRMRAISLDFNKIKLVFHNPIVRNRFIRLLINPKTLAQKLWVSLFTTKYK